MINLFVFLSLHQQVLCLFEEYLDVVYSTISLFFGRKISKSNCTTFLYAPPFPRGKNLIIIWSQTLGCHWYCVQLCTIFPIIGLGIIKVMSDKHKTIIVDVNFKCPLNEIHVQQKITKTVYWHNLLTLTTWWCNCRNKNRRMWGSMIKSRLWKYPLPCRWSDL